MSERAPGAKTSPGLHQIAPRGRKIELLLFFQVENTHLL
jgi:hypothetical protein